MMHMAGDYKFWMNNYKFVLGVSFVYSTKSVMEYDSMCFLNKQHIKHKVF